MKIGWFSCGITSAVACKLALENYTDVELYYIAIGSAHPDNERFIADCEKWYGKKINVVTNSKGYSDQFEVIEKTRYVNGADGARCTLELKKEPRYELHERLQPTNHIWGMEFEKKEVNRAIRFRQQYPNTNSLFPLIDAKLSKNECAGILQAVGIELPVMYKLGYSNNNCIGCVKGGMFYWNKIRKDFPEHFERMAKVERVVGATCLKEPEGRIYLDELDPLRGNPDEPVHGECGLFCQVEFAHIMHKRIDEVLNGELAISDLY